MYRERVADGFRYLRNVDRYNEWTVSAYLAMGGMSLSYLKIILDRFSTSKKLICGSSQIRAHT